MATRQLALALVMALAPTLAWAQEPSDAPQISDFSVNSQLVPGAQLTFTLEGTPNGKASVRINGVNRVVPLKETSAGVYQGGYTIRPGDRLSGSDTLRVTLQQRRRSTSKSFSAPWQGQSAN